MVDCSSGMDPVQGALVEVPGNMLMEVVEDILAVVLGRKGFGMVVTDVDRHEEDSHKLAAAVTLMTQEELRSLALL